MLLLTKTTVVWSACGPIPFPDTAVDINDESYSECKDIASLLIPSTVTSIGELAFYKSSVSDVTLESGLTVIGPYMFRVTAIIAIVIPSTITSIGLFIH